MEVGFLKSSHIYLYTVDQCSHCIYLIEHSSSILYSRVILLHNEVKWDLEIPFGQSFKYNLLVFASVNLNLIFQFK